MKIPVICTTVLVEKSPQAIPLGAACIASSIKNNESLAKQCDVSLFAISQEDESFSQEFYTNQLIQKCNNQKGIICFSVFVWNRIFLEKTSSFLRKKGFITIAGGPEVTANPNSFSDFDYLVCGQGEESVPQLIEKIIKNNLQISNVNPHIIPSSKVQVENLTSPYLDGTLNLKEYDGALWELARGCPFSCSYCYESKGEKKVNLFPQERLEKELDLFAKENISQVFVLDPTYNANKQRALHFLNLIAKKTPNTFYYFEARAEFIDKELARAFTKFPCAVQIGLQSSDENVLKLVNRNFDKNKFLKGINHLNQEGVIFGFDLIYGLPGESLQGFKKGIDFALSLYPNNLELFCLSVLPGTDLADRADDLHLNYQKEPPYHVINTKLFSEKDMKIAKEISNACTFFYNQGRAVAWFNSVCKVLKVKPSAFFENFAKYILDNSIQTDCDFSHKQIEKIQLEFVKKQLEQKNLKKYILLSQDLIVLNGALSRTTDTGIFETVNLNYPAEYLLSPYASDFDFFIKNVKVKPNKVNTKNLY